MKKARFVSRARTLVLTLATGWVLSAAPPVSGESPCDPFVRPSSEGGRVLCVQEAVDRVPRDFPDVTTAIQSVLNRARTGDVVAFGAGPDCDEPTTYLVGEYSRPSADGQPIRLMGRHGVVYEGNGSVLKLNPRPSDVEWMWPRGGWRWIGGLAIDRPAEPAGVTCLHDLHFDGSRADQREARSDTRACRTDLECNTGGEVGLCVHGRCTERCERGTDCSGAPILCYPSPARGFAKLCVPESKQHNLLLTAPPRPGGGLQQVKVVGCTSRDGTWGGFEVLDNVDVEFRGEPLPFEIPGRPRQEQPFETSGSLIGYKISGPRATARIDGWHSTGDGQAMHTEKDCPDCTFDVHVTISRSRIRDSRYQGITWATSKGNWGQLAPRNSLTLEDTELIDAQLFTFVNDTRMRFRGVTFQSSDLAASPRRQGDLPPLAIFNSLCAPVEFEASGSRRSRIRGWIAVGGHAPDCRAKWELAVRETDFFGEGWYGEIPGRDFALRAQFAPDGPRHVRIRDVKLTSSYDSLILLQGGDLFLEDGTWQRFPEGRDVLRASGSQSAVPPVRTTVRWDAGRHVYRRAAGACTREGDGLVCTGG